MPALKETKPPAKADHPPYIEMIKAAIVALKERNGSSRQAISKYIKDNYKVGESLPRHLKMALNRGVAKGFLVHTKGQGASGSFKVGASAKETNKTKKPAAQKKTTPKKPKSSKKPTKKTTAGSKNTSGKKKDATGKKKPAAKAKKPKPKAKKSPTKAKKPAAKKSTAPKTAKSKTKKAGKK